MKKKNFFYLSTTLLNLFLLTACIEAIEPQESILTKDQATESPNSFNGLVLDLTGNLTGNFLYRGNADKTPYDFGYPSFFLQRDVMGNDIVVESSSNEWYTDWYSCGTGLGPQYAICQVPWTLYYSWIKNCNNVISLGGKKPTSDKEAGVGIAYAMRAMFYMDLARMFATETYAKNKDAVTVPLILESPKLDSKGKPRSTNQEIWDSIISDLDKAEIYLANYKRSNTETPDLSVVYGLKARAYLTMENWVKAEEYAKKAQQGYAALNESQYTSHTKGFNEPNVSWMFSTSNLETDPNITLNDGDSSWGSQMIIEVSKSGCGYAANYGSPKRIDYHLYQTIPASDFRKKCFVDFSIDKLDMVQDKDTIIDKLKVYSDAPEGLLNTAKATTSGVVGGLSVKFRPKDGIHDNQFKAFTVSIPLMRVEEMQLIEAEAAGMQDLGRGKELLTKFALSRDPQYVYGQHTAETYGSSYATAFQNEVWWQRRVELWGEGFATFDIKRLDKAVIRSYAGTNHPEGYRWNSDIYGKNNNNSYPNWMDLCIVQSETNYNTSIKENNPTPLKPKNDSPEYTW